MTCSTSSRWRTASSSSSPAGSSSRDRRPRSWRRRGAGSAHDLRGSTWSTGDSTRDATLVTDWGTTWHGTAGASLAVGSAAVAVFAPSAVAVYRNEPHGSPRNTVEAHGGRTRQPRACGTGAVRGTARWRPRVGRRRDGRIGGRSEAGARGARVLRGEVPGGFAIRDAVTVRLSRTINVRAQPEIRQRAISGDRLCSYHPPGASARSCSPTAISKIGTLRATHTCVTAVTR